MGNNELLKEVRLQSWFQDHRQRYWVVDESDRGESSDQGIGTRVEDEDRSRLGLRDDEGIIDVSKGVEDDEVQELGIGESTVEKVVGEGRDDVVIEVVIGNDNVIEGAIDDNEEVLSNFDDSEDADYEESSEEGFSDDKEVGGSSEVDVDGNMSDDGDYIMAGDDCERWGMGGDGEDMGGRGSRQEVEVEDDEGSDGGRNVADDDDEDIVIIWPRTVRKRKVRPAFEDYRGIGIDSGDNTYEQASPGLRVERGRKRQRRMSEFVDSGVVMASSQDDGVVLPSSPPEIGGIIPRRSEDVKETASEAETIVERAVEDEDEDAKGDDPFGPQFGCRYDRPGQSVLDLLWDRLEKWCRTCPACRLGGDEGKRHDMTDCLQHDTAEIIDQAVVMQRHIERLGGFQGNGGCSLCGIPRAICQRWQAKANGGWEEVPGQPCQYKWKLVPAVITMMMDGSGEGWSVVRSWMDQAGVMPNRPVEVFEWFREGIWWEGIEVEVARIVRVFYMLVNKNRGIGKA